MTDEASAGRQHPNVARVVAAGAARGVAVDVFHFPDGTKTAADAAACTSARS